MISVSRDTQSRPGDRNRVGTFSKQDAGGGAASVSWVILEASGDAVLDESGGIIIMEA